MNKYQEALVDIRCDTYNFIDNNYDEAFKMVYAKQFKLLQELVDKATPKKPIKLKLDYMESYVCPNCRHTYEGSSYCRFCGQALDRGDENV